MQQDIINIDLNLPTQWEDLTDKQLRYVFALLSQGLTATEVKAYCLCRWAGLKVLHRYGNNGWACRHSKKEFILTAGQVDRATHALGWLDNVPTMPVRIARIGSHRAVPADFEGVPFETFIVCDNLYQGYLSTKSDVLLDQMASHLYTPGKVRLQDAERVSIFYWFASLKGFLAKVFKHFFQPAGNASGAAGYRASITLRLCESRSSMKTTSARLSHAF